MMWWKLDSGSFHFSSLLVLGLGFLSVGCGDDDDDDNVSPSDTFAITSPAFDDGDALPLKYTCDGKTFPYSGMPPVPHTLPRLDWTSGPTNTQSYAIVFKDVTLTTATPVNELGYHWAIWNIPTDVRSLPESLASGNPIAAVPGAEQVSSPLFDDGYIGPCPSWAVAPGAPEPPEGTPAPKVNTDSYTFTVFAFSSTLTVPDPPSGTTPSYVHVLDDFFSANALASAEIGATSDAQPAMVAFPPADD